MRSAPEKRVSRGVGPIEPRQEDFSSPSGRRPEGRRQERIISSPFESAVTSLGRIVRGSRLGPFRRRGSQITAPERDVELL